MTAPSELVRGLDIGRHVLILALAADKGAVQRVDHDQFLTGVGKLRGDVRDQLVHFIDEIEPGRQ